MHTSCRISTEAGDATSRLVAWVLNLVGQQELGIRQGAPKAGNQRRISGDSGLRLAQAFPKLGDIPTILVTTGQTDPPVSLAQMSSNARVYRYSPLYTVGILKFFSFLYIHFLGDATFYYVIYGFHFTDIGTLLDDLFAVLREAITG